MMHEILPSKLKGEVSLPSSKSYVQRFIAAAILAEGQSILEGAGQCDDIETAVRIGDQLGGETRQLTSGELLVTGGRAFKGDELFCRESGLCARLFTPIASVQGKPFMVNGMSSLERRHLAQDFVQLRNFGLSVDIRNKGIPSFIEGELKPGEYHLDCSKSSQMLSGLLFAMPVLPGDSVLYADNLVSRPYVDMTIQMMRNFGVIVNEPEKNVFEIAGNQKYNPVKLVSEADWSAGANLLVAAALCGELEVKGLRANSCQADLRILEVLKQAEVSFQVHENSVTVQKSIPQGFELDLMDCPDLFPAVLPLACASQKVSRVYHLERLINKESNRLEAAMREYKKLGANFVMQSDCLEIHPTPLKFADVNSWGDHRIIMSLTVAGLANEGLIIHDSDHVSKSWPEFFNQIKSIGGKYHAHLR